MSLPNMDDPEYVGGIISKFRQYLKDEGYSTPTVKNYISDLRHLIDWVSQRYNGFKFVNIELSSLKAYRSFVKEKFRSKPSIAARRLSSLRKFLSWANGLRLVPDYLVKASEQVLTEQETPIFKLPYPTPEATKTLPVQSLTGRPPIPDKPYQKAIYYIKYIRPGWYHRYHESPAHRPLHLAILGVFILLMANILFGSMIEEALNSKPDSQPDLGELLAAVTPPRVLSFQGRLTNASDVPIVSATDVVFKIYDARTAGNLLWTSKTWSVTPDSNGIFSVCLGGQDTTDDCLFNGVADTVIPSTLFSDNAALYLGVTAGADSEMTPRQRIAARDRESTR